MVRMVVAASALGRKRVGADDKGGQTRVLGTFKPI